MALVVSMAASAQNAEKLYQEGKALYEAKNYSAAFPKLKAAAEKGHKKAQYRLGRCYDKGHGVAENDALAFQWYQKGAAQNHAKSIYALGKCYKDGDGVEKNRQKAVELFSKAARLGNADAQYQLGKAYLKGKGVPADQKKARMWLTKAIKNDKDGKEIAQKIRKAAKSGDEDAKAILKLVNIK